LDGISGIEAVHQAICYYQLALVYVRSELRTRIQLELGSVYLELMYYADEADNAQSAIEFFELVLEKSNEREELIRASNGKSEGWWWRLVVEGKHNVFEKTEDFPFRTWARDVATAYRDNEVSVCYYAMSTLWMQEVGKEDLVWLHLAWTFLQSRHQSPPPGFQYFYFSIITMYHIAKNRMGHMEFEDLPMLLAALEHFGLFMATTSLREVYVIQRYVAVALLILFWVSQFVERTLHWQWAGVMCTHPSAFRNDQWNIWSENTIAKIMNHRSILSQLVISICGSQNPIDSAAAISDREALESRLQARLSMQRNMS
jgi:hypothetical protein